MPRQVRETLLGWIPSVNQVEGFERRAPQVVGVGDGGGFVEEAVTVPITITELRFSDPVSGDQVVYPMNDEIAASVREMLSGVVLPS